MLDSIVRTKNYSSSAEGMLPTTVPCDVNVNTNLSLAGLRIGLPSTFGGFMCVWTALLKAACTCMPAVLPKAYPLRSVTAHVLCPRPHAEAQVMSWVHILPAGWVRPGIDASVSALP